MDFMSFMYGWIIGVILMGGYGILVMVQERANQRRKLAQYQQAMIAAPSKENK
jgi:hypothetical protein